jgi:integrase
MASIIQLNGKWRAQVRKVGSRSVTKTFATKAEAEKWASGVEKGLDQPKAARSLTVSEVIEEYRNLRERAQRPVEPTASEHYTLAMLTDALGHFKADRLTPNDLVNFAAQRLEQCNTATINQDLSKLGTVLRHTSSILGLPFNDVVAGARPLLSHLRLISTGQARTRRPTEDELQRLFGYFREHASQSHLRMEDIVRAAITLGLRRGELFRVKWVDVDEAKKMLLVRDRKHPRQKKGNDQWIPLIGEAWALVQSQPRTSERIFPFHPQTVSKYFKKACDVLAIPDLHFHDMRREAASTLLELGWHERDVKLVTGHASKVFEVYAKPDPSYLHNLPQPPSRKVST